MATRAKLHTDKAHNQHAFDDPFRSYLTNEFAKQVAT